MANVEIMEVGKRFGRAEVLHGISIDIADGAFVVLVGPSGCGKSTLLRLIAGLETLDSGSIRIGRRVVDGLEPKDRNIAMVFQNYALYPHMTVAENMGFGLRLAKTDKATIRRKIEGAAEILGLEAYLERFPRQLSGGQRQRVAMGRAIVRQPEVFLFDEPLSNLDAKLRVQMRKEIKGLHGALGITSVYVTHDQVEAMTLADRVVVLNEGRIEQVGTGLDLYDHPANVFVAGFIGSPAINLVAGRLAPDDGTPIFVAERGGGRVPLDGASAGRPGDAVILGLRPESLSLARDGAIAGTVRLVEPTGSLTNVFVEALGTELCAQFKDRVAIGSNADVRLEYDAKAIHLFRRIDGTRLETRLGR